MNKNIRSGIAQKVYSELQSNYHKGDWATAEKLAIELTKRLPQFPGGWSILGCIYAQSNRFDFALTAFNKLSKINPYDATTYNNIGNVLVNLNRISEAISNFKKSIQISDKFPDTYNSLGNAFKCSGQFSDAEVCFKKAIAINQNFAEAYYNLGNLYFDTGKLSGAVVCFISAIEVRPEYASAFNNLGLAYKELGQLREAAKCYERAIGIDASLIDAKFNLLYLKSTLSDLHSHQYLQEAVLLGNEMSTTAVNKFIHNKQWDATRPIRVGFVSGDYKKHPVGYFLEGLMSGNANASPRIEYIAFPATNARDELTAKLFESFIEWHPIDGLTDRAAAEIVNQSKIDILIDLSGYTAHTRLGVFAYKPAPVQMSWLGYWASTGLPEIDYILGDPYVTPSSHASHFSESIWQLPASYLCFSAFGLPVSHNIPNALKGDTVIFGSFNNLAKVGDEVIRLWSHIILAVPHSKLFLKCKQLGDTSVVNSIIEKFSKHHVHTSRLIIEGPESREQFLESYKRVDIALDTFPHPGGTTTAEALLMGVPVLTLKGDRFLSRVGESILSNVGLNEWISSDTTDYLRRAVMFANDFQHITKAKSILKENCKNSSLFNSNRFKSEFEKSIADIWQLYVGEIS